MFSFRFRWRHMNQRVNDDKAVEVAGVVSRKREATIHVRNGTINHRILRTEYCPMPSKCDVRADGSPPAPAIQVYQPNLNSFRIPTNLRDAIQVWTDPDFDFHLQHCIVYSYSRTPFEQSQQLPVSQLHLGKWLHQPIRRRTSSTTRCSV